MLMESYMRVRRDPGWKQVVKQVAAEIGQSIVRLSNEMGQLRQMTAKSDCTGHDAGRTGRDLCPDTATVLYFCK